MVYFEVQDFFLSSGINTFNLFFMDLYGLLLRGEKKFSLEFALNKLKIMALFFYQEEQIKGVAFAKLKIRIFLGFDEFQKKGNIQNG